MTDYLEVLRLSHLGYSQRTIESVAHCSRHTVRQILQEAENRGIHWPLDEDVTNADLECINRREFAICTDFFRHFAGDFLPPCRDSLPPRQFS